MVDTVDVFPTSLGVFVRVKVKFMAEGDVGASDEVVLKDASVVALELTFPLSPEDKVKFTTF